MLGKIAYSLLFLLLVWGNAVAGLKVGLACPDWPLCHGKVLPPFRWDIYMEFMHRVIGAITSVFIILLSYKRFRNYTGEARLVPVLTVFLLLFQLILGGVVVLLKLPVNITTFHFLVALIIFSLTLYMAFFNGESGKKPVFSIKGFSGLFFLLGILVLIQAVLGAYVRHSEAGLACPDFPKCLGYWVPPHLAGIILTHFSHRSFAYLIFIAVLFLYGFSFVNSELNQKRAQILTLVLLILLQIIIGIGVIHSKLYFLATAFHLAIALLMFSAIFYFWFQEMVEKRV